MDERVASGIFIRERNRESFIDWKNSADGVKGRGGDGLYGK